MTHYQVGFAEVDYDPPAGLPLRGNFRDDYAARGTHDPLRARAMVFRAGAEKVALLSVDILMIARRQVAAMRRFIASRCDLPGDRVLIAATHTHAAPGVGELWGLPSCPEAVAEAFLARAASAVVAADADLADAELAVGQAAEGGLSFNRRLRCKDGRTHMNWERPPPDFVVEPLGPIDPRVGVLSVARSARPVAAAVNFGLHPAILAGDNWLYSADYPGCLAEALRRVFGDRFVTAFFNAPCGDVNHIDYADPLQGRGWKMAQRVGYVLAAAACQAVRTATALPAGPIAVSRRLVPLERIAVTEVQRREARAVLDRAAARDPAGRVDGLPPELHARSLLEAYDLQHAGEKAEVMAVRIGRLGIVGLPGEAFCQLGLRIRHASPADATFVIELANDAAGYLPTREAFEQGGYEPTVGVTRYGPGAGERLAESAVEQLNELFG